MLTGKSLLSFHRAERPTRRVMLDHTACGIVSVLQTVISTKKIHPPLTNTCSTRTSGTVLHCNAGRTCNRSSDLRISPVLLLGIGRWVGVPGTGSWTPTVSPRSRASQGHPDYVWVASAWDCVSWNVCSFMQDAQSNNTVRKRGRYTNSEFFKILGRS